MQAQDNNDTGPAKTELAEAIARALYENSAYKLPKICEDFGLAGGTGREAFSGKIQYVLQRLAGFNQQRLLDLATKVVARHSNFALEELLESFKPTVPYNIGELTRRALVRELDTQGNLSGHLDIRDLLSRVWPLKQFEAAEYDTLKGCFNLDDSIYQHMVRNDDWSITEILQRLNFYSISNRRIGKFLELVVSPLVRDAAPQKEYAERLNTHLIRDGVELRHVEDQSGYPVYRLVPIERGVSGRAKNLIFAADGPKPELVLVDAVNNDIKIVANAEFCLILDEPIPQEGLLWKQLVHWWARIQGLPSDDAQAGRSLYRRLAKSLASEPERTFFRSYYGRFMSMGDRLPALVPQVYLHYDPYTRRQLGNTSRLTRQRMDFLLLLSHYTRVVIEIDGQQHYSEANQASPQKYAEMVSADRALKLAGYDVYRFGGAELQGPGAEEFIVTFFNGLFEKHHRL